MSCLCLSSSCTICSSWNASAYGKPSNKTLVHTTHSDFPPKVTVLPRPDAVVLRVEVMRARVVGGIMSTRAVRRSVRDSERGSREPRSEAEEISESEMISQFWGWLEGLMMRVSVVMLRCCRRWCLLVLWAGALVRAGCGRTYLCLYNPHRHLPGGHHLWMILASRRRPRLRLLLI